MIPARAPWLVALTIALAGTVPAAQSPASSASPAPASPPLEPAQIVSHLERTIGWFRHVQATEQQATLSDEIVSREQLRESSTTALQLAFDFAHAAALLARPSASAPAASGTEQGPPPRNFDQAAARLAQRVATLESRLADVNGTLARAPARSREALVTERDELTAALALARDIQATVQSLARFAATSSATSGTTGGLSAQIDALERSVAEARHTQPANAKAGGAVQPAAPPPMAPAQPASAAVRPESEGVVALATDLFALGGDRRQLTDTLRETDALLKAVDDLRAPLVAEARTFVRQVDAAATSPADAAQAQQTRGQLEAAATEFKKLATALVPLGEQGIAVETSRGTLTEWRDDVSERFAVTARYLFLRVSMLAVAIIALLVISEIWRRATFRYLHDARRRRQLLVLRRVVVAAAIAVIIVVGFVSEVGSLATYAGLLTAGIAVAMQNVILAVVAYFFLIGRYGVRVGDRITLAGVTGKVIDIGLVRIYLMELAGTDLHPTGRVVVLSNAVLFQPAALFKQVPGADYVWHAITVTLTAASDSVAAESRLKAAAESVYEEYRPAIERQHANLQRFVDVETSVPQPDVRSHLTEAGLECTVRYPVDATEAAGIDRKMVAAIRKAIADDTTLTLVSSTGPTTPHAA